MAWFKKEDKKIKIPEGLWIKCNYCREIIYRKEVEKSSMVCPKCKYHFYISVEDRIALIIDDGSFKEMDGSIYSLDPLEFKDSVKYKDRIKNYQKSTGYADAFIYGEGKINELPVIVGIFNFKFMGGSMGSVVGEKILRAAETSMNTKFPLIIVSASGGARMQEGILSLMQMAKTSAALSRLSEMGIPYISILTDPTFGGVTASFAMLGDIIIAEPKALIGFAGPRVVEQTIKQQLPDGFQRAEFLLEHGMIDMIVERKKLKDTLSKVITFFSPS
ncbi:MAG: acetyl-CoA carboxylase carboxyltransferase subunit beta [Nitrospirae bacterium]|nr:acetyl-CoA carboxylase carboxyltransferase subunit beta [Nitrospirota bacterium]